MSYLHHYLFFLYLSFYIKVVFQKIHILSIILIFLLLGNRSSIFFTNMLHKSSITLHYSSFPLYTIFLFYDQLIFLTNLIFLTFFQRVYEDGNAMPEMRNIYIYEFFRIFSHILAGKFQSVYIPYTSDGLTYDAHNFFLSNILRDQYIGLFKTLCWFFASFVCRLVFFWYYYTHLF